MKEIHYYLANDGKKFDEEWDCIEYETQKALETHKDEFQFFNYCKEPIPIEKAIPDEVVYIIVKSDSGAEAIGNWFDHQGLLNPFDCVYCECVGTWVYGDIIDRGHKWLKLELEIQRLQNIVNEINKE